MLLCSWLMTSFYDVHAQEKQAAALADGGEETANGYFPKAYKLDRHEKTWAASPFSREVLPPPPRRLSEARILGRVGSFALLIGLTANTRWDLLIKRTSFTFSRWARRMRMVSPLPKSRATAG